MSEYDAERQKEVKAHILSIARQLIAGKVSIIVASRELGYLRHEVDPQLADVLMTFAAIDSETDELPVGEVRKEWNATALERKDKEIAEADNFYRESALDAATKLIRMLETPS